LSLIRHLHSRTKKTLFVRNWIPNIARPKPIWKISKRACKISNLHALYYTLRSILQQSRRWNLFVFLLWLLPRVVTYVSNEPLYMTVFRSQSSKLWLSSDHCNFMEKYSFCGRYFHSRLKVFRIISFHFSSWNLSETELTQCRSSATPWQRIDKPWQSGSWNYHTYSEYRIPLPWRCVQGVHHKLCKRSRCGAYQRIDPRVEKQHRAGLTVFIKWVLFARDPQNMFTLKKCRPTTSALQRGSKISPVFSRLNNLCEHTSNLVVLL